MRALLGRLKRLAEMDAAELGYRLRERLHAGLERTATRLAPREESDRRFLRRLPGAGRRSWAPDGWAFGRYLSETVAPRFYLPSDEECRGDLVGLVHRCFPDWGARIAEEAEHLLAHRFEILGHGELDCGPEIDWHRDPVTGKVWKRRFWSDYDLVRDCAAGDPKRVCELNRHQHLARLAKASYLLGEERFARDALAQILGWIRQNPPGRGVNWHSSLEIALRVISWLWALFFLLPSGVVDEASAQRIGKSLFAQLDHVYRYPSVFSSPNTHLLGEATALFVGGLLFYDWGHGSAWLARGSELLADALDRQVGRDGVHGELSSTYHCYALEFYLQVVVLADRNGHELPPRLRAGVEAMLEALMHLSRPDGSPTLLGDDDGGRALALAGTHYGTSADLLCTGAVLFGRGTFKGQAGAFRESTLWLLGRQGWLQYETLSAAAPTALAAAYPEAGYFVQRSGWGAQDHHLVFDCGGLGKLSGGHGHADALSLVLFAGGQELLVDPGTFVYNGQPEWRDYFRSTAAHNTVVVDGGNQSEPGDTFRWRSQAGVRLLDEASFEGIDYVAGEHDGYLALPAGVVHRRRLVYLRPDYWLVLDDFRGEGEHTFDVLYHLAPGATVVPVAPAPAADSASLVCRTGAAGLRLFVHASAPLEVRTVEASAAPPQGWVSRRYGERQGAPVVVARFHAKVPAAAISLLAPFRANPRSTRPLRDWKAQAMPVEGRGGAAAGALALSVRHRRGEDLAILSPGGEEVEVGPCRGRGSLFWVRHAGGRLERLLAIDADRLICDGVPVFTSVHPINHFSRATPAREGARRPESGPTIGSERLDVWHRGSA